MLDRNIKLMPPCFLCKTDILTDTSARSLNALKLSQMANLSLKQSPINPLTLQSFTFQAKANKHLDVIQTIQILLLL